MKLKLLATAAAVAVAALTIYWTRGADHEGVTMQGGPSASISLLALGNEPLRQPAPETTPPRTVLPPTLTKSQEVDRLGKSANPRDRFKAYQLVRACLDAPREAKQAACGDISPGQMSAETRLQWLTAAAKAGVWGSFAAFNKEGPGGQADWISRNYDTQHARELERQWQPEQEQALLASARAGDPDTLLALVKRAIDAGLMAERGDPDMQASCAAAGGCVEQAVALALALDQVAQETNSPYAGRAKELVSIELKELSPQRLAFAEQRSRELVAAIKSSPYYASN